METNLVLAEKELADLCRSGDHETIDAALSSNQKRQSGLSRTALKLFKELSVSGPKQRIAMILAVLYTVSDAELMKLRFWPGYFGSEVINSTVLKSVPRERLNVFADLLLNTGHFSTVEELYHAGMIDKPISNGWVSGLIAKCSWPNKNRGGLEQFLVDQPEFLSDDVWLLFKFDGTAESCLSGADKYLTNAGESWQTVLIAFSKQGKLDRQHLLDESLRALTRDFNQFRAGWFSRFHEAMQPTAAEQELRLESYLKLLNSPVPPTVSFALAMILSVEKASPIAFASLSAHLPNALTAKSKLTVLSVIKLLQACADREPSERKAICLLACSALVSEHAEVQSKVIALIAKFADQNDSELRECIESYVPALAASVKKSLPSFLQPTCESISNALNNTTSSVESLLPQTRLLIPISDLNELVLKAAFVLEHPEEYCDYELVLDGILRNCARDQSDFAIRTSSLLKRAHKLNDPRNEPLIRSLCRLIIAWITDELPDVPKRSSDWFNGAELRMQAIIERVRKREPLGLLSLPTNEFGWLDPDELRRRLNSGLVPDDPWDKCFALLRLQDADTALVDSIAKDSKHPALAYARLQLSSEQSTEKKPIDWSIKHTTNDAGYTFTSIEMEPDPLTLFPGNQAETRTRNRWDRPLAREILLAGSLMPNQREVYFATGAQWLGGCLQYTEVLDKHARFYLQFLQDPSTRPQRQGSLLLVLAVSTDDRDITVAGIDTFITVIAQQRLDFTSTAEAMHTLFHHDDCVKANRWAKNFSAIAKASPEHSRLVFLLLQQVLSTSLAAPLRDLHYILELLVELQAEHGGTLQPEAIACLTAIKTGGQTKKLVDHLTRRP